MKRTSPYYHLKFVVQANQRLNGVNNFENIAAFDHQQVAVDYAELAARSSPAFFYRVMKRDAGDQLQQVYPELTK